MGATSTASNKQAKIEAFVANLKKDYPDFSFKRGSQDVWSPKSRTVFYNPERPLKKLQYSLLHELAHAVLEHADYTNDFELLKMESEAWQEAAEIGRKYAVDISDDHIQHCLDTYRDWLHRRSTCPSCGMHVLQSSPTHYRCFNCQTEWSVTDKRFSRAYRRLFHTKNVR
jgi:hypothetical protein